MKKVTLQEFALLAKYIHDLCGIVLDQSKTYLIESRLGPLLAELKCASYGELYYQAQNDRTKAIPHRIVDAISTNETYFFRDKTPFELLKYKILPDHIDRCQVSGVMPCSLNIWSAACSTGQEVYSIAITIKELLPNLSPYRIKILGTDISDATIAQASYGRYNKVEIERGLPPDKLARYFQPDRSFWRIKDEIRAMASFQKLNLLEPFTWLGKFDIVFCRNVAIYFSPENRAKLFNRIAEHLNPYGVLIIGSTESLIGVSTRYVRKEYHNAVFYQLRMD